MINQQSSRAAVATRWAKRPLVLFLIAAALLALLTFAERQSEPVLNGTDIATRESFADLFSSRLAGPATAMQLPFGAQAASPEQAVISANQTVSSALAQTQAATAAAQAAQNFPPFVSAIVCPILLQARATVITVIGALIGAFPNLAPQLEAVRASALETIDAQLEAFGCPGVSPNGGGGDDDDGEDDD